MTYKFTNIWQFSVKIFAIEDYFHCGEHGRFEDKSVNSLNTHLTQCKYC